MKRSLASFSALILLLLAPIYSFAQVKTTSTSNSPSTRNTAIPSAQPSSRPLQAVGATQVGVPSVATSQGVKTRTAASEKIGELDDLAQEYEDFQATLGASGGEFRSTRKHLRTINDSVLIHAYTEGDPAVLRADLEALGMTHIAVYGPAVGGLMPIKALRQAATLKSLALVRPSIAKTSIGLVTSEGDIAMHSDLARLNLGADGTGMRVGILSDSFNCLGAGAINDINSGDLPSPLILNAVNPTTGTAVLKEGPCTSTLGFDEGRAMAQIVHDIAPGASIMFYSGAWSAMDFAIGINTLRANGANVIVDDEAYLDEPYFQDGPIAQAAQNVVNAGGVYVSAAGNDARNSYESPFRDSMDTWTRPTDGRRCKLHNFDPGGLVINTKQGVIIPPGWTAKLWLQWDQPFKYDNALPANAADNWDPARVPLGPGSASELDLLLFDANGNWLTQKYGTATTMTHDPVQYLQWPNPNVDAAGNPVATTAYVSIALCPDATGALGPVPTLMKYVAFDHGPSTGTQIVGYPTHSGTIVGHRNAAGVVTVGAADWSKTPAFGTAQAVNESASSAGGTQILFDTSGNRLPAPESRSKPEVVGPDNVVNTFFGQSGCAPSIPSNPCRFRGTSAAAPHVAGVAALLLSQNSSLTPPEITSMLETSASAPALPMADTELPVPLAGEASGVKAIATGGSHTCVLTTAGAVQCWGSNSNGQLGNGTTTQSTQPVTVSGLNSGVAAIVAGDKHTCALTNSGGVQCWGYNAYGQLGNGMDVDSLVPVNVVGLSSGVTKITAGLDHACAIVNGSAECWGNDSDGQTGNGTSGLSWTVPQAVKFPLIVPPTITDIAAGGYFVCALDSTGAVWCWGRGVDGELGNGGTANSSVPVQIPAARLLPGITMLAAGAYHACALAAATSANNVQCWGYNGAGEVGIGKYTNPPEVGFPAIVTSPPVLPFTSITAGQYHTCAMTATPNDVVQCWGSNSDGQLGDGSGSGATVPVTIFESGSGVASVSAGGLHTCVVTTAGAVQCWGSNAYGQVGAIPGPNNLTGYGFVQAYSPSKTNQTIFFISAPTVAVGGTGTVTATASSGLPVTFYSQTPAICAISGSTVTGVAAGTCSIAANQAGNATFDAAPQVTDTLTVTSTGTSQTITFGPAPSLIVGGTATVTATATSGLPVGFTSLTPTICTNPLFGSNSTITGVKAGTCTIAADQAGNATFYAAPEVTQNISVKINQTITFGPVPALMTAGSTVTVTATASSGLPVTLTSTDTTVCTITGTTVFGVTAGACTIAADQLGNATYTAAPEVTVNITVKINQSITFALAPPLTVNGVAILMATASSGLPVTFSSLTSTTCTVFGSTAIGVATGTCTLAADQAGDSSWNPAPEVTQSITVTAAINTPVGQQVSVQPVNAATGTSPATLTFSSVTQAGATSLTISNNGPAPLAGFGPGSPGQYYSLDTTAIFFGPISVCINYAGVAFVTSPQLFHYTGGAWTNVTTGVDTTGQIICGSVTSLSPFAIFEPTTFVSMITARWSHTATLLNNGNVLIAGGSEPGNPTPETPSAELYDAASGTFTATGSMAIGLADHTATLLNNGMVLIVGGQQLVSFPFAGGYVQVNLSSNIAELYDPSTGIFTATGYLNTSRYLHTATLLADGKVLIAGGFHRELIGNNPATSIINAYSLASAEIYDPATGKFTDTGSMASPRDSHTATLLNSGKVLVAGGEDIPGPGALLSAESYDPATGTFTSTGSMDVAVIRHTATLLNNGKVLVVGNGSYNASAVPSVASLYDPATGNFTPTGSLMTSRGGHTATLLSNGEVLVAGGFSGGTFYGYALASTELYDPATGTFTCGGNMTMPRGLHTATLMNSGMVLIAGGFPPALNPGTLNASYNAEFYQPSAQKLGCITVGPATLAPATVGVPIATTTFTQTGGTGAVTFTASGVLPNGVMFSNGTLSGTPTQVGNFPITITATDSNGSTGTQGYALTVNAPVIVIGPATLPTGTAGVAYVSTTFTESGGAAPATISERGVLPAGMSFTGATLGGTPASTGIFPITIAATDANGFTANQNYTLTISCPTITVGPAALAAAMAEVTFAATTFTQAGAVGNVFFTESGALPNGITFSNGTLSGIPKQAGNFPIAISATDSNACTGTQNYVLTVSAPTIGVTPASLTAGTAGVRYAATTFSESGGAAPVTISESGALPAGMSFVGGTLAGTPTTTGSFPITIIATDADGFTGSQAYTLMINCPPITVGPTTGAASGSGTLSSAALLQSISVAPANIYMLFGSQQQFTATGVFADGSSQDLTAIVSWRSSRPIVATISAGGVVTSVSPGSTTITAELGSVSGSVTLTVTDTTLVALWHFDGNTYDSSGYGNYGIPVGSPAFVAGQANFGEALSLDGATQYVSVPNSPSLNPRAITVEGWINASTYPSSDWAAIVNKGNMGTCAESYALFVAPGGFPGFLINNGRDCTGRGAVFGTSALPPGWNHVAGTYDGGNINIYVNGMLSFSVGFGGTIHPTANSVLIGGSDFTGSGYPRSFFDGLIDEVHIWARALSADEILRLAEAGTIPLASATAEMPFEDTTFTQTGGVGNVIFTENGVLPNGVTFSNGTLSGTPTQAGNFPFRVTATDSNACAGSQNYVLPVNAPTIAISPMTLPAGRAGAAYPSTTFTESGVAAPVGFSESGALPAGMSLTGATLAGTPTSAGSFPITITVTDANGFTGSRNYILTININCPTITIGPAILPSGTAGAPLAATTFTQTGGVGNVIFTESGLLPNGVTFSNGTLAGTPTQAGNFPINLTVTDSNGCTGTQKYVLTINAPTFVISPATLAVGTVGVAYLSTMFTESGGMAPVTFSESGLLPAGMTFTGTTLAGTPTSAGSFPITITVTDANGFTGSQNFTLTINKGNQTITLTGVPSSATFGQGPFPVNASATSGLTVALSASGNCLLSANSLSLSGVGSCTVNATQGGNGNYNAAPTVTSSFTIGQATTTTNVRVSPATVKYSDYTTLTATVSSSSAGGQALTGTVQFYLNGPAVGSPVSINSSGVATLSQVQVKLSAGNYTVKGAFSSTNANFAGSSGTTTQNVTQENAFILYTGDTIAQVGTTLNLRATVWDSAAAGYPGVNPESGPNATIGDITNIWIAFDIYQAASCLSGTPTSTLYAHVTSTSTAGVGTATTTLTASSEVSYCALARVVAGSAGGTNQYYTAPIMAQPAGLDFYVNSGQFATGGGWVNDPSGSHGNFGFNARYNSTGSPKGQMVYVYRALYNGVLADFIIKSNALTALQFSGRTYPISSTLQGKANVQVNRGSDGLSLFSAGNYTFSATVTDSGQNGNAGKQFSLIAYDSSGVPYHTVQAGTPLQGGNVVVHSQ